MRKCKKSRDLEGILKISQTYSTNVLKGAFPNMIKNKLKKDSNYVITIKNNHCVIEYKNQKRTKGNYICKIAFPDVDGFKKLFSEELFSKFFVFLHYNFNVSNSKFSSRDFLKFLGKEITYRKVDLMNQRLSNYSKAIMSLKIYWETPYSKTDIKGVVPFIGVLFKDGYCTVDFHKEYIESMKDSFYHLPQVIGQLSFNAFIIADFVYTHARKNRTNEFAITMETLYKKLGMLPIEEIRLKYDRSFNKVIKEPIYEALDEIIQIMDKVTVFNMEIELPEIDSDKLEDFLNSKIKIKLTGYNDSIKPKHRQKRFNKS